MAAAGRGTLSPTLRDTLLARHRALDAARRPWSASRRRAAGRSTTGSWRRRPGCPEPALTEALARRRCSHHVLKARDDGFAFRHALLQEVAYAELLPGERARLHAAFAAALEARPDLAGGNAATVAAEIAHHWLRAGDKPRALAAAVRAGSEAERIGALAEAARHHRRALELWDLVPEAEQPAGVDRATLLARAANAPAWTGDPAEAIRLVDAAIALVDPAAEPVRAALLHQRRGILLWQLGRADGGHARPRARRRADPGRAAVGRARPGARRARPDPDARRASPHARACSARRPWPSRARSAPASRKPTRWRRWVTTSPCSATGRPGCAACARHARSRRDRRERDALAHRGSCCRISCGATAGWPRPSRSRSTARRRPAARAWTRARASAR